MVSTAHEAMHRIFREDPHLLARVLPRAGIPFPEATSIEPLDTDLTEIRPVERRVDSLFRVHTEGEEGGFLLAVEAQGRPDADKPSSWTYYLAHLYAKYRLPPILLVVCRDKTTAAWAAEPIRIGRRVHTSMVVFPLVLGPGNLPAITDPEEAAGDLALAVLSALAHAKDPGHPAILDALAAALSGVEREQAYSWAEFTETGLGDARARTLWRELLSTYTLRFPGSGTIIEEAILKGREEGREKARAEDILRVLRVRGIDVSDAVRERVGSCDDLDVLGTWLDRAVTVGSADELFGAEPGGA
jgi:hypothetical protein